MKNNVRKQTSKYTVGSLIFIYFCMVGCNKLSRCQIDLNDYFTTLPNDSIMPLSVINPQQEWDSVYIYNSSEKFEIPYLNLEADRMAGHPLLSSDKVKVIFTKDNQLVSYSEVWIGILLVECLTPMKGWSKDTPIIIRVKQYGERCIEAVE